MSDGAIRIINRRDGSPIRTSMHVADGSHVATAAETAERLANKRSIRLAGDVTGEGMFDGSDNTASSCNNNTKEWLR